MAKQVKTAIPAVPAITLDKNRVQYFPVTMLTVKDDYNVRMFDPDNNTDDMTFVKSIVADGKINTPLVCRIVTVNGKPTIEIMQGHRRRAAVLYALDKGLVKPPFPNLPVLGAPEGMSEVDRTYDLGSSNSGKRLTAIENARLVARLIALNEKPARIAVKLGFTSGKWASDLARIASAPDYLANAIYAEHIKGTLAGDLVRESASKGFDIKTVWEGAAELARAKSKYDPESGRYVWHVQQKHLDVILAKIGAAMDKSRGEARAARTPDTAKADAKPDATAPAAKADATPAKADAKPGATVPVTAHDRAAPGAATPDAKARPVFTIAGDGITIRDVNGNRLAICEDSTVAREMLDALHMSGRMIVVRPLTGKAAAPARLPMTDEGKKAAQEAAERAKAATAPKVTPAPAKAAQPVPTPAVVAKLTPAKGKPGRKPGRAQQAA